MINWGSWKFRYGSDRTTSNESLNCRNAWTSTGSFQSNRYGKFSITNVDLSQMLQNFNEVTPRAPTQLPIDYDHLSMDPKKPGDGIPARDYRRLVGRHSQAVTAEPLVDRFQRQRLDLSVGQRLRKWDHARISGLRVPSHVAGGKRMPLPFPTLNPLVPGDTCLALDDETSLNLEFTAEGQKIRHSKQTASAAVRRRSRVTQRLSRVIVAPAPGLVVKPDGNPRCRTFAAAIDPGFRTARSNPDDGNNFFSSSRDRDGPRAPPDRTRPPLRLTNRGPPHLANRGPWSREWYRKKPRHPANRRSWRCCPWPEKPHPAADRNPRSENPETCRRTNLDAGVDDGLARPAEPSRVRWTDSETRPTTATKPARPVGKRHRNNGTTDDADEKPPHTLSTNNADSDARELAKHTIF